MVKYINHRFVEYCEPTGHETILVSKNSDHKVLSI
jgi:ribosomal protein L32E